MASSTSVLDNVRKIVDGAHTVPSLPENVVEALRAVDSPDSSAGDVADYIEQDVGLSSKMLQVANSAYYSFRGQIASVPHAVALLGTKTIRSILVAASVNDYFQKLPDQSKDEARRLWRHSVICANAARIIARQVPGANEEEAFLTGLLHDLGISVVFVNMPREFRKIMEIATQEELDFREAERKFWPYTHELIGAEVLRRWDLPDEVPLAVGLHHADQFGDDTLPLATGVYLADRVALAPETEEAILSHFAQAAANTEQLLELTAERVADWLIEVMDTGTEEAELLLSILS
jgi:putative nucleotidyltransferase with HDIG domain